MAEIPEPNDSRMWRQLLARAHPDAGGSDELFVWAQSVREHMEDLEEQVLRRPSRPAVPTVHPGGFTVPRPQTVTWMGPPAR